MACGRVSITLPAGLRTTPNEGHLLRLRRPRPPWNGSVVHHYTFTLYAIDVSELEVKGDLTGVNVREALNGHVWRKQRSQAPTLQPHVWRDTKPVAKFAVGALSANGSKRFWNSE